MDDATAIAYCLQTHKHFRINFQSIFFHVQSLTKGHLGWWVGLLMGWWVGWLVVLLVGWWVGGFVGLLMGWCILSYSTNQLFIILSHFSSRSSNAGVSSTFLN